MTTTGKRSKPIARGETLMSDLHKAMEMTRGVDVATLDHMLGLFEASAQFTDEIKPATQTDYRYCRGALQKQTTKIGVSFADLRRSGITAPLIQRLVNDMAKVTPAKANHVKRYLSVAFQWGF